MTEEHVEDRQEEEVELSEVEQQAYRMGWRPKEEFEGEEDDWIEAEEFVARAPLFKNLNKQKREITRLQKQIDALARHNKEITQATKDRQIEDLKRARREALEARDADAVEEIDSRIEETEKIEVADPRGPVNQEFEDWLEENDWYQTDFELTAIADSYASRLKMTNPDMSSKELLDKVSEFMNKKYLDSGETPSKARNKSIPDAGSSGSRKAAGKSTYTPTAEERQLAKEFVASGVFESEKEYYDQLKMIANRNKRA